MGEEQRLRQPLRAIRLSITSTQAAHLDIFAWNTGTYLHLKYLYNANGGDLLFEDWDPKGQPDGHIDHMMVVTGRTSNGVAKISQKTPNRHDITVDQSIALAQTEGRTKIVWYGLKNY